MFEKYIKNMVNVFKKKIILISIVCPPKKYLHIKKQSYCHIVQSQINKYNNVYKKIAKENKRIYYIDLEQLFTKENINKYDILMGMLLKHNKP